MDEVPVVAGQQLLPQPELSERRDGVVEAARGGVCVDDLVRPGDRDELGSCGWLAGAVAMMLDQPLQDPAQRGPARKVDPRAVVDSEPHRERAHLDVRRYPRGWIALERLAEDPHR